MKVGDLIQVKINAGPWSTGLVCNIESNEKRRGGRENRHWTLWEDGDYSWISEKDYAEIINESR